MKRVWLIFLLFVLSSSLVFANQTEEKISDAITLYKSAEYSECIKNLNTIISQDSNYPISYYYLGLCYAKTNQKDKAIKCYDKVISSNAEKSLKSMAKAAKDCLGTSGFTALDAQLSISKNSKAEDFLPCKIQKAEPAVSKPAQKVVEKPLKKEVKEAKAPTNEEIGAAIMTLKKAGLWENTQTSMPQQNQEKQNQEMMAKLYMQQMTQQMSNPAYLMMNMNNNNNNNNGMNMMNMLPFMMNNQGGSNSASNQQFIQTMMMSQMMPNLDFSSNNDKY